MKNNKLFATVLCASLLAITMNSAFAQMPPPNEEGLGGPRGRHHMESPQARQQKIAEFEKRLNLTTEQKAIIEKNRAASKKKLDAIRKKEIKLHEEKKAILDQNKKDFESILTETQKAELKKIEAERKAEFEKRKSDMEKKIKEKKETKTNK